MIVRAKSYDQIKPLNQMCKQGRLFDVQKWIAEGKPVNPPIPEKGARQQPPLQISIEKGFHSMVEVLLKAGAEITSDRYDAMGHALQKRRLDVAKLLLANGARIEDVNMLSVFETWDPAVMEYFINQGADVNTDFPLATALCWKVRTAIGILKRHKSRFPSFQEQANIALRHHCREGDLKWVSLLLWAGADPYAKGWDGAGEQEPDPEDAMCALEYAALSGHTEIFKLKQVRLDAEHPVAGELLWWACHKKSADLLIELIKLGLDPVALPECGTRLIQACLQNMGWDFSLTGKRPLRDLDTIRSRESMKMIYFLAHNGVRWQPKDNSAINDARRSFLKLKPDYAVEFIWIMSQFCASSKESLEQLVRTPAIRRHVSEHLERISELIEIPDQETTRKEGQIKDTHEHSRNNTIGR